ncbi:MAG: ATP-binding cassette domain-containing protein [Actinomycetaceae bacterium]|nr:ATP-binding cassette domain-containing protein [Arcanobacterium sp.]MDD7686390.1 ATP-binding cassette domain-containing protein [Actinomycetaceae bacterium]MDY5272670.1 ATP-binding cassette domain-containing protein [Arcanobacterium sp.]
MGDVLDVRDVWVRRSGNDILHGVNLSINDGERWVILGPNGAGKTTLVKLISGRMHPTRGAVEILGERLGHVDVAQLRPLVGLSSSALDQTIPQSERVLNVVRTAAYGMSVSWREEYAAEDDARARELLAALDVLDLADRQLATLSTGEKKRVGIARALMPNPEVLVLDEPASGLDLGGRERLLSALGELAREQYAPVMVMVTHHVEEIPAGFTHALLLKEGEVFAAGELASVLTSAHLSALFGVDVQLTEHQGRFAAVAQ